MLHGRLRLRRRTRNQTEHDAAVRATVTNDQVTEEPLVCSGVIGVMPAGSCQDAQVLHNPHDRGGHEEAVLQIDDAREGASRMKPDLQPPLRPLDSARDVAPNGSRGHPERSRRLSRRTTKWSPGLARGAPLPEGELGLIAVAPWILEADEFDRCIPQASKRLLKPVALQGELIGIGEILQCAAAARAEVWAWRLDRCVRGFFLDEELLSVHLLEMFVQEGMLA